MYLRYIKVATAQAPFHTYQGSVKSETHFHIKTLLGLPDFFLSQN